MSSILLYGGRDVSTHTEASYNPDELPRHELVAELRRVLGLLQQTQRKLETEASERHRLEQTLIDRDRQIARLNRQIEGLASGAQ